MVRKRTEKETFELLFVVSMLILTALFVMGFILNPNGSQAEIFFAKAKDYMGDFINVVKYTAGRDPYLNTLNGLGEKPYLPLAYLIMFVLGKIAKYKSSYVTLQSWGYTTATVFTLICSAVFFFQLYFLKNGNKLIKRITVGVMFASGIFLFSFERGNLIFLSAIFTLFYLVNYNSSNKVLKETAFICLALAAALKVYPALFGILLIYERRYKEAFRVIIYGIVCSFLPFLFFHGGFSNIPQWIENVRLNSAEYLYRVFPRFGQHFVLNQLLNEGLLTKATVDIIDTIISVVIYISVGILLIINKYQEIRWKKLCLLTVMVLLLPVNSAFYNGLYLFTIIVYFLNEDNKQKGDLVYLVLFVIVLNPFQLVIGTYNLTHLTVNLSISLLFILLIVDNLHLMKNKLMK